MVDFIHTVAKGEQARARELVSTAAREVVQNDLRLGPCLPDPVLHTLFTNDTFATSCREGVFDAAESRVDLTDVVSVLHQRERRHTDICCGQLIQLLLEAFAGGSQKSIDGSRVIATLSSLCEAEGRTRLIWFVVSHIDHRI